MTRKSAIFLVVFFLLGLISAGYATDYPGVGVICSGDLWESYMPTAISKYYSESNTNILVNMRLMRMGNFDRQWYTPTQHYPGGDIFTLTWNQDFFMTEYSNTDSIGKYRGANNKDPRDVFYADAFWMPTMYKANEGKATNGNTQGGVAWATTDRYQQIYEFSFPTNIGVNVRCKIRGFSFNEANMNDFIAMELELTNTGIQDLNCDGIVDRENHDIKALALWNDDPLFGSMRITTSGGRWSWGNWPASRYSGYDATPDPEGNPWAVPVVFATNTAENQLDANKWATDGNRYVGYRSSLGIFFDIWNGSQWIAVKEGKLEAGSAAPDKKTIYDSHPIGVGKERGWYVTHGRSKMFSLPYGRFVTAVGTFFEEGGKSELTTVPVIKPDPNYFDTSDPTKYVANDPLSFVNIIKPAGSRGEPKGDMKDTGKWLQNWEKNYPGTPAPKIPTEDEWLKGGTVLTNYNFDSGATEGVGPFSLKVGESMTAVMIEYAGYRLKGARNALRSARWAYEQNWNVPVPPPMPDMNMSKVELSESGAVTVKPRVIWDDKAEKAADFAGYKIYRVTAYPKINSHQFGVRLLDNYHKQGLADIGLTDSQLETKYCEPINPNWSVPKNFNLDWDPSPAGPWKIQAYIPKADLAKYLNSQTDKATYKYEWIDKSTEARFGYTYWYYVAAFDNESGSIGGRSFTSLESGKANWNGRDGKWMGIYPHAIAGTNIGYPAASDAAGRKAIGAPYVLNLARADVADLISGKKKIGVKPNPYKVQAPHDVGLEHKVVFYNLPMNTKITILDLSGQIMDILEYYGTDPTNGTMFWDMFTKDGPEVQSGLYIWLAEYPGGKQQGYLAIMR